MKIDNFKVTPGNAYIIAEIGNNHNGSISLAMEMIDQAIEAGANCVKFQMRTLNEVYRKQSSDSSGEDLGTEYVVDLLKRFELSKLEHKELFEYCKKNNITYLCTPWDAISLEFLDIITSTGKIVEGLKSKIELSFLRGKEYAPLLYPKLKLPDKQK